MTASFFEISLNSINLFSIMIGMSLVVLSSLWNGRIRYTRVVFVYLAGLTFYYGFLKPNHFTETPNTPAIVSQQSSASSGLKYPEARVPPITEITGRGRKQ
jgi:hypothetical protein